MPTDRVRVFGVSSVGTRFPGLTLHTIDAENREGHLVQYETTSNRLAAACRDAKDRTVDLTWKPTKYGRTLVAVDPVEATV